MSKHFDEKLDFRVTDVTKPVKLNINPDNETASVDPKTVPSLLNEIAEKYPQHPALKYKDPVTNEWSTITYAEYKQLVDKLAKIFIKLGLKQNGTVCILAFNSCQWHISQLAAIIAGGIACGIYTMNSVHSIRHVLEATSANIIVVDDSNQMEKVRKIKDELPNLNAIIQTLPPFGQYVKKEDGYWRWSELLDMNTDDVEEEYQRRLKEIVPNKCCCNIFTSGTTGTPKGALLSHDNFTWISYSVLKHFQNFEMASEVIVSYLPLSHVAATALDIFAALALAATVYFADKDALKGSLVKTLAEVRPTIFLGVPRVFEKFQEKIIYAGSQTGIIKRNLGAWAKSVTLDHHMNKRAGQVSSSLQYKIASTLILSKIKKALGFDRLKVLVTGAAPMSEETKKYFLSLDLPIIEAYGMSETSGIHSFAREEEDDFKNIGKAIDGAETKIINPNGEGHGEICIRGRNIFMGYINDYDKTIEAIDDEGWLHTGDLGYINDENILYITGRIKELVITAGGENIPPAHVENLVKAECSAISNAILIGDRRKYLTMLISLKTVMDSDIGPKDDLEVETLKLMESLNLKYTKLSEILAAGPDQKVVEAIQEAINRANLCSISNAQKVQKFAFLPHDFSIPTGELGPTMKLKRSFVIEKYHEAIEKLYS